MKIRSILISFCLCTIVLQGCGQDDWKVASELSRKPESIALKSIPDLSKNEDEFDLTMFNDQPKEWGERVTGVKTQIQTEEKKIALTFDACGGPSGNEVDEDLLELLKTEEIPATLFINEQWIIENEALFLQIAKNPLFQIENHGSNHSPLSVNGGSAWGIEATASPEEAYEEIMINHERVKALTGRNMTFFRSGTAYYDEIAVQLAEALGYTVVNFDILGDAGATYSSEQVKDALIQAEAGSIALMHMNQPNSGTAHGVKQALPILKERGFTFVLLETETLR